MADLSSTACFDSSSAAFTEAELAGDGSFSVFISAGLMVGFCSLAAVFPTPTKADRLLALGSLRIHTPATTSASSTGNHHQMMRRFLVGCNCAYTACQSDGAGFTCKPSSMLCTDLS